MFLTRSFCHCERQHAEVETKDEEVVACGAMKVCFVLLFNLCFQYSPFLTVVRCKRKKTKWQHVEVQRRTQNDGIQSNGGVHFLLLFIFSTNGALFLLLWGANQRRRSCDMRNEGVYFLLLNVYYFIFRYSWGTSEDEKVAACGATHFLLLLSNSRLFSAFIFA